MTTPADLDPIIAALRQIQDDWRADMARAVVETARADNLAAQLKACQDTAQAPARGPRKPPTRTEKGTAGTYKVTAPTTFDAVRFECWVTFAAGIAPVFNDCEIVGPPGVLPVGTAKPLVKHFGLGNGYTIFNHCAFYQDHPSPSAPTTGIKGHNFEANNCVFHHLSDMIHAHVDTAAQAATVPINVTVRNPHFHDFVWWAKDMHPDGTHTDGIQNSYGGRGLTVTGGLWDLYLSDNAGDPRPDRRAMSGMMLADMPAKGGLLDMTVDGVTVNGGQVTFNYAAWGQDPTLLPAGTRACVNMVYGDDVTVGAQAKPALPLTLTGTGGAPGFEMRKRG